MAYGVDVVGRQVGTVAVAEDERSEEARFVGYVDESVVESILQAAEHFFFTSAEFDQPLYM